MSHPTAECWPHSRSATADGGYGLTVLCGLIARRLTQQRTRALHHCFVSRQKPELTVESVGVVGA
jgi:hypothetical protein